MASFTQRHLEQLLARKPDVPPAVNQIECHPYRARHALVSYCRSRDIVPCAWMPLASGKMGLLDDPVLAEIAARYKTTPASVILRWLRQRGVVPLPRTVRRERMAENLRAVSEAPALSAEDMAAIDGLDADRSVYPHVLPERIA